ncbi:MAG: hypothetical protein PHG60_00180 [Candidatus Dojkabacteria bacterium]|jgi:hypothetical protein|nr:hypothetical protein [Candidatus Dojkabacteria bacterium]MDD2269998.1 hypothetical protein [Candidatus Dojkabacteria bacterium]
MILNKDEMKTLQRQIDSLSIKIESIENKVVKIDESKDFDYQKVLSAIKYLYRYYDDMNKDKIVDITLTQQ